MDNELSSLSVIFTEFYYWITVVLMFFIHVGFCMYEVGVSRHKNHVHTLMKNTMLIPLVTITFFFFGWWIYFAFPNGPGIIGGLVAAPHAVAWSELMGPHLRGCWRSRWLGAAQRRVLGGVPAVFLDGGLDCLRLGHRADPLLGLLDFGDSHRLGILGH